MAFYQSFLDYYLSGKTGIQYPLHQSKIDYVQSDDGLFGTQIFKCQYQLATIHTVVQDVSLAMIVVSLCQNTEALLTYLLENGKTISIWKVL